MLTILLALALRLTMFAPAALAEEKETIELMPLGWKKPPEASRRRPRRRNPTPPALYTPVITKQPNTKKLSRVLFQ